MKYPLRSASIHVAFHPFCWGLQWVNRTKRLAEFAKETEWDPTDYTTTIKARNMKAMRAALVAARGKAS